MAACAAPIVHLARAHAADRADREESVAAALADTPDVFEQQVTAKGQPEGRPVRLTTGLWARTITPSADGTRLAYDVVRRRVNIWMTRIGSEPSPMSRARQVTNENWRTQGMSLSPDGQWLTFDANKTGTNSDIYKQRLDGGSPVQLTDTPDYEWDPVWSPRGDEIASTRRTKGIATSV